MIVEVGIQVNAAKVPLSMALLEKDNSVTRTDLEAYHNLKLERIMESEEVCQGHSCSLDGPIFPVGKSFFQPPTYNWCVVICKQHGHYDEDVCII